MMSPPPAPSQERAEITERVSWVPISMVGRQDGVVGRAWTWDQTTLRCAASERLSPHRAPSLSSRLSDGNCDYFTAGCY